MFPLRYTVHHLATDGMTTDALGNDQPKFAAPVPVKVYAWSSHRDERGHDGQMTYSSRDIDLTTLMLPKRAVALTDRFILEPPGGDVFEVIAVRDGNRGFHGWRPGIAVVLKRVEG